MKESTQMANKENLSENKKIEESNNIVGQIFEFSKTDEESLLKLMSECDFSSSNAENFIHKLQAELSNLDTANIESIMNSEENTLKLIDMLDNAVNDIDKIDKRLQVYEDKIKEVGDAVRIVAERDGVIQLQENNQHELLDKLNIMITALEFSPENKQLLNHCDFKTPEKIEKCISAANLLLDIIEADLPKGLSKMKAYEEQKKSLEYLKFKFCNNSYNHLRNAIAHSTNCHLETYKIADNSLNALPSHKQIHDDLLIFRNLLPWIFRSTCAFPDQEQNRRTFYNDIKLNYIETVKQLHLREIIPFCNCAKSKISKCEKTKSTASMENIKGSFIRTSDKSHGNDFFTIKIDQATKEMFKLVFIKLLNQITTNVQDEQHFCQEFFNTKIAKEVQEENVSLESHQLLRNNSFASQNSDSKPSNTSDHKSDLAVLSLIFANIIEEQVKSIIDNMIKAENMIVIFIYSDLLYRVLLSHNNKQYMHQPLVSLLRTGKEKCDEFVNHFKETIREYKVNKKEKIGILRYITYFEEFVKEAEISWEPIKKNMYEKLCNIYQIIVNEIFKGIEAIANESQKTPPDVVRFQNYQQMNHVMRSINGLKDSTKYSRDQYVSWKQSYIREHFGRPLEKLHNFFEKVDAKIERGYKHQDISYQLDLSANNLREVIREYPAREVKKGLDTLYNKVQKHLVENSSLIEVVWRDMSNEFIKQYKNYEHLIQICYPGQKITLEFTEADICKFFEEIAQTH